MLLEKITFRKAAPEEMPAVLLLLKQAALWLQEKKVDYWQNWIDPAPIFTAWIRRGFDNDEFFMVESDSQVIGCFRLQWKDQQFWGLQEDNAGYIHSFTVSRKLAGRGTGYRILNLIEEYCRERGKVWLRLDCGADVPGLRKFYERFGFRLVKVEVCQGFLAAFYEKPIDGSSEA